MHIDFRSKEFSHTGSRQRHVRRLAWYDGKCTADSPLCHRSAIETLIISVLRLEDSSPSTSYQRLYGRRSTHSPSASSGAEGASWPIDGCNSRLESSPRKRLELMPQLSHAPTGTLEEVPEVVIIQGTLGATKVSIQVYLRDSGSCTALANYNLIMLEPHLTIRYANRVRLAKPL